MALARHFLAGLASVVALSLAMPAQAASDHASGDGSSADNERLLPDVYPTDPVLASSEWLREPYHPFFDVDWAVGLRGTYTSSTAGERFDVHLLPSVSLQHLGTRSSLNVDASADIVRPNESGTIDISALRLELEGGYAFDSATELSVSGNLAVTQQTPGAPGLASNVTVAPQTVSSGGSATLTRQFGRFNVSLSGAAQRTVYGTTTFADGTVQDNSAESYWALDSGLRLGFQATPIFEVFGQAGAGRDIFDYRAAASADANDYSVKGGVTGRWSSVLEATGSVGLGLRKFDNAGVPDVVTQLYDARLTFTPDPTWRMTAGFATTVTPPGPSGSGTTRVDYAATAEVAYTVNSWLALRALADWNTARFEGSSNRETGHGYGVGADYQVNAHTALSADYDFDHVDSSVNGAQTAHRMTMGVTVSR